MWAVSMQWPSIRRRRPCIWLSSAVGIEEGDEVLVPTMTFAATAEVVLYFKAKPVLVDCQPDTLNLDPDQIEKAITAKTKAIIPVHIAGQACDMDRILEIARELRPEGDRRRGPCPPGSLSGEDDRDDRRHHLLFVLCHQDDHDRRRRHGHDGEPGVG